MEKTIKIFKTLSEKGYRVALSHTIEGLDELPLNHPIKIAEMALVCEWLRVNYNIEMWVAPFIHEGFFETPKTYSYFIYSDAGWENDGVDFESPQEAYSAAFDYVLNNLI